MEMQLDYPFSLNTCSLFRYAAATCRCDPTDENRMPGVEMSKTHDALPILVPLLALLGLMSFAPESSAKRPKKKKATETFVYRAPTIQLSATPTVLTACEGQKARVQLDARATFASGAAPRYRWSSSGGRNCGEGAPPKPGPSGGWARFFQELALVEKS